MVNVLGMTEGHWAVELSEEADVFLHSHAEANGISLSNALADLIEYGILNMKDTLVTESNPGYQSLGLHSSSFTTFVRWPTSGCHANLPPETKARIAKSLSATIAATLFKLLVEEGKGDTSNVMDADDQGTRPASGPFPVN